VNSGERAEIETVFGSPDQVLGNLLRSDVWL